MHKEELDARMHQRPNIDMEFYQSLQAELEAELRKPNEARNYDLIEELVDAICLMEGKEDAYAEHAAKQIAIWNATASPESPALRQSKFMHHALSNQLQRKLGWCAALAAVLILTLLITPSATQKIVQEHSAPSDKLSSESTSYPNVTTNASNTVSGHYTALLQPPISLQLISAGDGVFYINFHISDINQVEKYGCQNIVVQSSTDAIHFSDYQTLPDIHITETESTHFKQYTVSADAHLYYRVVAEYYITGDKLFFPQTQIASLTSNTVYIPN